MLITIDDNKLNDLIRSYLTDMITDYIACAEHRAIRSDDGIVNDQLNMICEPMMTEIKKQSLIIKKR